MAITMGRDHVVVNLELGLQEDKSVIGRVNLGNLIGPF